MACIAALVLLPAASIVSAADATDQPVNFNTQVRSILSNRCFTCHGPDDNERQGNLRLDTVDGAVADLGGHAAVVPGKPAESELIARITAHDPDLRMPPAGHGEPLNEAQVDILRRWIAQGAEYSKHWSYSRPVRPALPDVSKPEWVRNEIDRFILARLDREGLQPTEEADRPALIRRLSLDLTGLPPAIEDVDAFVSDTSPDAYEKLVDRLLARDAYGEHWARMWLDLARYADSAGYADDPSRTIWAYRDYVIRALNKNVPFDQFTIEQIAGDLLPEPTEDQLIATAFHRNTLTNNEGGTNDEEFRNVAIVDRVNTTMAVWMGTTIACAQCHNHKYDPISQQEYFQVFAVFNNTADADRRDESPLLQLYTNEQKQNRDKWQIEAEQLEKLLTTPTPELVAERDAWQQRFSTPPAWMRPQVSSTASQAEAHFQVADDQTIHVDARGKTETYTIELTPSADSALKSLTALQLQTLPGGNFVVSRVRAAVIPPQGTRLNGRYVRVELPGSGRMLSLAEVQVFSGSDNIATNGEASQSSTDYGGPANLAIDGNTNGDYQAAKSTTHTASSDNPWWEVDLKSSQSIDRVHLWNRTDNGLHTRLTNFVLKVLDQDRKVVWEQQVAEPPNPDQQYALSTARGIPLVTAFADYSQQSFEAAQVLNNSDPANRGWAVGGQTDREHQLTLIAESPIEIPAGSRLSVTIEQISKHENHTLAGFRLAVTSEPSIAEFARIPAEQIAILAIPATQRSEQQQAALTNWFVRHAAPSLEAQRKRAAEVQKLLADLKPATSVPVMADLPANQHRTTRIQHRGNFEDLGDEVSAGLPGAFHDFASDGAVDRMTLARWLIDESNPLTPRVIANRYWEAIFGVGIVSTSEEFGSQGDPPLHPELLDWLATELIARNWDRKAFLKLLVTSAAYRQSSRVTDELVARDPDNRLLARGPRFRLTAEMIRDQALFVSGLLDRRMYGEPVRPVQPSMGLSAAFGSAIDWKTSTDGDQYRRGLYTTWRRSNPYPSMAAFDAPNREVCTVKRDRTNTPLQALVTLNDPVYVETAQALARRIAGHQGSLQDQVTYGFRLCSARQPEDVERDRLVALYEQAKAHFANNAAAASEMATMPLGPVGEGQNVVDLAAWTVVGNVLLNLDEMFMKR